jgi:2-C-methyl-D-erythritol 4-phosphate cytidylyltransferase
MFDILSKMRFMEPRFTAIVLMAGIGSRFGSPTPKQFHQLGSKKIYLHTLETFLTSELFHQIILVCHPDWIDEVQKEIPFDSQNICHSRGPTRQSSSC